MTSRPVVIAHRAGNAPSTLTKIAATATMLEADVHLFRGRLEVRHAKTLGPIAVLWERWYLLPRHTPRPHLAELLTTLPPDVGLLLDLKGLSPRLARRVRAQMDRHFQGRPYWVCARNWWLLRPFTGLPDVRTIRSAGTPSQLARLLRHHMPHLPGVSVDARLMSAARVNELRRRTDCLLVWGASTQGQVETLVRWGVTGLILDEPALAEPFVG